MERLTQIAVLGLLVSVAMAPASPALKLKGYMAVKAKAANQAMFAAQDRKGNYYMAGTTSDTPFDFKSRDWLVAKFSPTGKRLWHRTFNGKGNAADIPGGLAVDRAGNVFVCGYTNGAPNEGSVGTVVKWNPNGVQQAIRYQPGTIRGGFEYDDYRAMKLDHLGNVFVAGSRTGTPANGVDLLVEKLTNNLVPIWSKTWNQVPELEQGLTMDIDANGGVFVGGDAPLDGKGGAGFWTFDPSGNLLRFHRFLGSDGYGRISQVSAMGSRVHVFGDQGNDGTTFQNVYTPSGGLLMTRKTPGNATIRRFTAGGAVGPDGSFLHCTSTNISGPNPDVVAQGVLFNRAGVLQGLCTANLPQAAYGEGAVMYAREHAAIFYSAFNSGSKRLYYAPVLDNVLQSKQAVVLNLSGQTFDRPSVSSLGEVLVPYSESSNGAAGIRSFEPTWISGGFRDEEVKLGQKVRFTYFGYDPNSTTTYVRVRVFLAGREAPLFDRTSDFRMDDQPALDEIPLPAGAKPGETLVMSVQRFTALGQKVGPAEVETIRIVP